MIWEYLLNSAVLVSCGKRKILVDGIFSDHQNFDIMDKDLQEKLMDRKPPFDGLNLLLFTHCHSDHYSKSKTIRFLERNPQTMLFLPPNGGISRRLAGFLGAKLVVTEGEEGRLLTYEADDLLIEYMKVDHLTFDYPEHYCINIVCGEENITFTADMDFNKMDMIKGFTRKNCSTIFINHLDMLHRKWRNSLLELGYGKICFYHLPSSCADGFGYRDRALRNWSRYQSMFPNGQLLMYEPKEK